MQVVPVRSPHPSIPPARRTGASRILWVLLLGALLVQPAHALRVHLAGLLARPAALLAAALLALAIVAMAVRAWPRRPRWLRGDALRGLAREATATAFLVALFGHVARQRANTYFTTDALWEGMRALGLLHAAGTALALAAARRTATDVLAGMAVEVAAWLVALHWLLAVTGLREAGGFALIAAGATLVLVLLLRVASVVAARARRRAARAGARALALVLLPALASSAAAAPACDADAAWSIRINLPAYRLDLLEDERVAASWGVAIGQRKYRTPVGRFAIERLTWNPWWIPPRRWWARHDTVTPPGPANPMGRVKLQLEDALYVHGSPLASSIGHAASHACLRMRNEDAVALAARLHALLGVPLPDSAVADSVTVALPVPVPVCVTYELAEVRADSLLVHPDVYRRAPAGTRPLAMRALLDAGLDTTRVVRARLARLVRQGRTRHAGLPLDSLLAPAPDVAPLARGGGASADGTPVPRVAPARAAPATTPRRR